MLQHDVYSFTFHLFFLVIFENLLRIVISVKLSVNVLRIKRERERMWVYYLEAKIG